MLLNASRIGLTALLAATLAPLCWSAELQGAHIVHREGTLELRLKLSDADSHAAYSKAFALTSPHRIVLDLPGVAPGEVKPPKVPGPAQAWVKGIRFGRHQEFFRLVLDASTALKYRVGTDETHLVLSVQLPSSQREVKLRPLVLVIDPGHGGIDPGTVNSTGLLEKEVALEIGMRLYNLLKPLTGFEPHLTRSTDEYLTLPARREKARSLGADIFLSIHADSAKNAKARGASAYVLSLSGASSEAARRLADRENATPGQLSQVGGIALVGDRDFDSAVVDLAQTPTIDRSLNIADSVLMQIRQVSEVHGSGVGRANFSVLRAPYMPSILLEAGFLSNRRDSISLTNARFQRRLVRSVLEGIFHYLQKNPHPGIYLSSPIRYFRYRVQSGDALSQIAENYGMLTGELKKVNRLKDNRIYPGQILKIPVPSRDSK